MKDKTTRKYFIFALTASTFALLTSIVTFPLLQDDLENLKTNVFSDMYDFREATDALWNDLLQIERESVVIKRDISLVYSHKPFIHRKAKLQRKRYHHRHIARKVDEHSSRHYAKLFEILRNKPKQQWGRRVAVTMKTPLQRVYGQAIINKSGRGVFTDAELIGLPGERESKDSRKGHHQQQCGLRLNFDCPQGPPGPPGEDASDGENGLDGLPGRDGLSADDNYGRDCILCPAGPHGPSGPPGPPGPDGTNGPDGEKGQPAVGPPGPEGAQGLPGPSGVMGPPGVPGEAGRFVVRWVGSPGEKGLPGPAGRPGLAGERGRDGETGARGSVGADGKPGLSGEQGRRGKTGRRGKKGRRAAADHFCNCPPRTKSSRGFAIIDANSTGPGADQYPKNLGLE